MMLVANAPLFSSRAQTGWINCGDPIPSPQPPYVLVPYPANSDSVLYIDPNGVYSTVPLAQAGPPQYMQISGNFLEIQSGGAMVIPCIQGLQ
jgi:hypothetical protein